MSGAYDDIKTKTFGFMSSYAREIVDLWRSVSTADITLFYSEESMAEVEKFTDSSIIMLLKHSERKLKNDSNKDIIDEKSELNYSLPLYHSGGLTDIEYYRQMIGNSYIYGRNSKRESEAVTCCSWIITLPKSVSDYSSIDRNEAVIIHPEEERKFFEGALQFVSERYGTENIIHNRIHYDEGKNPHIHIYFLPRKEIDHDKVHYKTVKSKKSIKTESGRWEYTYRYKLDENGNRIALKNYAKLSDYYDNKLSAAEIINPVELKHFHPDFAKFLKDNNLPGADSVFTGTTDGKNVSVKSLKELTRNTGLTLDQISDLKHEKAVLEERITDLEQNTETITATVAKKDQIISELNARIETISHVEVQLQQRNKDNVALKQNYEKLSEKLSSVEKELTEKTKALEEKQNELDKANKKIRSLEEEKTRFEKEHSWGNTTQGWGERSQSEAWGKSSNSSRWGRKDNTIDVDKTW